MSRKNPPKEVTPPLSKMQQLVVKLEQLARREEFLEISFGARGVQTNLATGILATSRGYNRRMVTVTDELKELALETRLETVDLLGRPWYALTIHIKWGFNRHGFEMPKIDMDRQCEPHPHGQPIPPEDLFLDFIEFPRENKDIPQWVMDRM